MFYMFIMFALSPDKPDCSGNQTVCTCNTENNCNSYNASSTFSPALSTTTMADTMRYSDDDDDDDGDDDVQVLVWREAPQHG